VDRDGDLAMEDGGLGVFWKFQEDTDYGGIADDWR